MATPYQMFGETAPIQHHIRYPGCILGLSWAKAVIASGIVFLSILGLAVSASNGYHVGVDGCGIWMGMGVMVVTGILGIVAVRKLSKGILVAYLVMAILGTVCAFVVIGFSVAWSIVARMPQCIDNSWDYRCFPPNDGMVTVSAFEAISAILAIAFFVIAIVGSSMACCSLCKCCKSVGQDQTALEVTTHSAGVEHSNYGQNQSCTTPSHAPPISFGQPVALHQPATSEHHGTSDSMQHQHSQVATHLPQHGRLAEASQHNPAFAGPSESQSASAPHCETNQAPPPYYQFEKQPMA